MKKVILMACAVAMLATVQAKPVDNAKLSINKNNRAVTTAKYQRGAQSNITTADRFCTAKDKRQTRYKYQLHLYA